MDAVNEDGIGCEVNVNREALTDTDLEKVKDCLLKVGSNSTTIDKDVQFACNALNRSLQMLAARNLMTSSAKADLMEIITQGSLKGLKLVFPPPGRFSVSDQLMERVTLSRIYGINSQLALEIARREIVGGHGSTSASLVGVLDHGLRPQDYLREIGILIASGEGKYGSHNLNNKCVSLTNWYDERSLTDYAGEGNLVSEETLTKAVDELKKEMEKMDPNNLYQKSYQIKINGLRRTLEFIKKPQKTQKEQLQEMLVRKNFPVIYLVGEKTFDRNQDVRITAMHNEFAVEGGVGKEGIKIILVPSEEMNFVRQQIEMRGLEIAVSSIEDYELPSSARRLAQN